MVTDVAVLSKAKILHSGQPTVSEHWTLCN